MSSWLREEVVGDCRLYLGDCRDIMESVGPVSAVLTDPPYGIAYESGYATNELWLGGRRITGDRDLFVREVALHLIRETQGDVPILAFGSRKRDIPEGCKMVLVWDKGPALGMGDLSLPWKPSSEEIYVLGSGFVGVRDESNVLYCPPVQSMAKNGRVHPNEKPVNLLLRLLRKLPRGKILDPFMGSGSTGVACVKTGRPFVGIEVEPQYFDAACERISKAYSQPDIFIEAERQKPKQESLLGGLS